MILVDHPHDPWSLEWNRRYCSKFLCNGQGSKCACGLFTPPPLIQAWADTFQPQPTRFGNCTVGLGNRNFTLMWAPLDRAVCSLNLRWDAGSRLYSLRTENLHSLVPMTHAPTQWELFNQYIHHRLQGNGSATNLMSSLDP